MNSSVVISEEGYFVRIIDGTEFGDDSPFALLVDNRAASLNLPENLVAFDVLRNTVSSYILVDNVEKETIDRFEGSLVAHKDSGFHEGYIFTDSMLEDEYIEKSIEEFANEV